MSLFKKILMWFAAWFVVIGVMVAEMPAWLVGTIFSHYTDGRLITRNEAGSFWHGSALLVAVSENKKIQEPLMRVNWDLKLGLSKFVTLDLKSYNKNVANIFIDKNGANVNNVDMSLAINQLTIFLENLNSLNLTGNIKVNANNILIAKKMSGNIQVNLGNIGSGMSPVNPLGSYNLTMDLSNMSINVNSSGGNALSIDGSGNTTHLELTAKVDPDKRDDMLQFMTMVGVPQGDGAYVLKVY
ncbi:MAG: hypothetical protein EKK64_02195 [Neisseriaceae bacterium]|nr:MAG: hypothetical protein EKK64_02195 [Neisseriaceae bacterium]